MKAVAAPKVHLQVWVRHAVDGFHKLPLLGAERIQPEGPELMTKLSQSRRRPLNISIACC